MLEKDDRERVDMALKKVVSKVSTVKRRFYFYSIYAKSKNNKEWTDHTELTNVLNNTFNEINKLVYSNDKFGTGYQVFKNKDGNYVYMIINAMSSEYIKFQLVLSRDKLLPYVEEEGKITPLSDLFTNKKQRLAEITHGILFRKTNTLALEYNNNGAKKRDLVEYIESKSSIIGEILFTNLVNPETLSKLKNKEEMSLLRLRVKSNSAVIGMLIQQDTAFNSLNCKKDGIDSVEVILRRRITKKKPGFKFDCLNKDFVSKLFKKYKEDFDYFNLRYASGTEELDMLNDQFICKESFVPISTSRTIPKEEAFNTIIVYYNESVKKYVIKDDN